MDLLSITVGAYLVFMQIPATKIPHTILPMKNLAVCEDARKALILAETKGRKSWDTANSEWKKRRGNGGLSFNRPPQIAPEWQFTCVQAK
jgi:hypothetical protein